MTQSCLSPRGLAYVLNWFYRIGTLAVSEFRRIKLKDHLIDFQDRKNAFELHL